MTSLEGTATSLEGTVTSLEEAVTSLECELSSARDVERMLNDQVCYLSITLVVLVKQLLQCVCVCVCLDDSFNVKNL